jgi:hypothetical protein
MITLKLTESIPEISKSINKAIAEELNDKIQNKKNDIVRQVKQFVNTLIETQPEIQSLKDGALKGAFGIIDSDSAVANIIQALINSIEINVKRFNNDLTGGLTVNIQPSSFRNLLGLPQGFTVYSGGVLHWLDWLLLRGDTIIIVDYQYNPKTGLGRSGLGNMVEGGSFRVPPQFAGSDDDNFITRALLSGTAESEIIKILEGAIS